MATIGTNTNEKIYQIKRWLGLNENPDGDTKLKMGEANECRNWRITRDGNLQRRPGMMPVAALGDGPVQGLWSGWVAGHEYILAAKGGQLRLVYDGDSGTFPYPCPVIGTVNVNNKVHIFGFAEKAYILDGATYQEWDAAKTGGTYNAATEVTGYIPLVAVSTVPAGGGTALEQVNKLTASRRVQFSPDGTATVFKLPEEDLASVDAVTDRVTGETMTGWTANTDAGTVTFTSAPAAGSNTIEITYTASASYRSQVEAMRFSELYNGTQENRVFLYGDGSNEVFYSGLDTAGNPRADYFPDLNVADIGAENTEVTGLIRHYSRLIAYKTDGTYSISYSAVTLEDGSVTAGFYVTPVNRTIGNGAPGQVALVLNSPRTLFQNDLYEWRGNARTGNLTNDERQAYRISDRIHSTLSTFNTEACLCFDDNANQEYYIVYNGTALVNNYAADAWYKFNGIDITCMCSLHGETYFGTSTGNIRKFSDLWRKDTTFYGVSTFALSAGGWTQDGNSYYKDISTEDAFTLEDIDLQDGYSLTGNPDSAAATVLSGYGITAVNLTVQDATHMRVTTVGGVIDGEDVNYRVDCYKNEPIDAYWESGAMDFNADYRRKYSSMMWVSVKPQTNSYVEITLITDRKSEFAEKAVSTGVNIGGFLTWDFRTFSFSSNIQPQVKKIRLKAKKFGYYRLIFKSNTVDTTATVLGIDIRVRQTGYIK